MVEDSSETFGAFLLRKYHEWSGRELARSGRIPSQAEFATDYLDVKTTTLSTWINDHKHPSDSEVIDGLADKLGNEVYDRLKLPRKMPRDKRLRVIADLWKKLEDLGYADQWYEIAQNIRDGKENNDKTIRT